MLLLDTDVVIDFLRGLPAARVWLASLPDAPGVPGFVVMELIEGCKSKQEVVNMLKSIRHFSVYWASEEDCSRALADFERAWLSHGLGVLDSLIGECAVGNQATLCTFNTRHFRVIPSLVTLQPYERNE